ncbi:MAG: HAD family hydrolase [Opitutales bacterium]
MQEYTHILWDWNGTLLDDSRICVDILNTVLATQEMDPIALETYREIFEFPVHRFYRNLSSTLDETTLKAMSSQFVHSYEKVWRDCKLHGDALETLYHFQNSSVRQIVLSASNQETLDACLNYFELSSLFEKVIGQDNCHAHGKLGTAREWLSASGIEPAKVLLVGDTLHDLEIAQELGFDCALFSQGHNSEARLKDAHPWVIASLGQLKAG